MKKMLVSGVAVAAALLIVVPAATAYSQLVEGTGPIDGEARVSEYAQRVSEKQANRDGQEQAIQERLAFLGATEGVAASAQSAAPNSNVISACQNKRTGVLRVSKRCNSATETPLKWNIEGPPGPGGSAIVYEDIFGPFTLSAQYYDTHTMTCSRGGTAINAGYLSDGNNFYASGSWQSSTGPDKWFLAVENNNSTTVLEYTLTLYCLL